ncbi:MAG: hypothetical protein GX490_01290 [Bacilli bacterium]|nr:hypothetical protein [Bacilli bacterium]
MKIKVTLISDLCTGTGDSFAGFIDIDTVVDENGIPYIPGRRFKGLLRDASIELLDFTNSPFTLEDINALYGETGKFDSGALELTNGYIENYEQITSELNELKKTNEYAPFYKSEFITDIYTRLITQTTIERSKRSAKEGSLRVSRVVNRGLVFYFDLYLKDKRLLPLLQDSCKVLRHMGLNRTRGFGEIRCELVEDNTHREYKTNLNVQPNQRLKLTYRLLTQLMLAGKNGENNTTFDYIPGSTLLGTFASLYIRKNSLYQDAHLNPEFYDIFLSGKVQFGNAYITDNKKDDYEPVSLSIYQAKDNERLIYDKASENPDAKMYNYQLRSLKGKYVRTLGDKLYKCEPLIKVEYHHLRPESKNIGHAVVDHGQFFQYEVLLSEQLFNGYIDGPKELLEKVIELLPDNRVLTVGRSKTAQYGKVYIEEVKLVDINNTELVVPSKGQFVVKLVSPLILINENGNIVPDVKVLIDDIKGKLGNLHVVNYFVNFTTVAGFINQWKLPKVQMQALSEGTTIVFRNDNDTPINVRTLELTRYGIRTNEGYGQIIVEERKYPSYKETKEKHTAQLKPKYTLAMLTTIQTLLMQYALELYINREVELSRSYFRLNSTTLNRIIKYIKIKNDYQELHDYISLIKDHKKRNNIRSALLERTIERDSDTDFVNEAREFIIDKITSLEFYKRHKNVLVKSVVESIESGDYYWYRHYMKHVFTLLKLNIRGDKNVSQ